MSKLSKYKLVMTISNAIQYFSVPLVLRPNQKEFESHLFGLQQIFKSGSQERPQNSIFLANILNVLSTRYYQLATKPQLYLQEAYLNNKFIKLVHQIHEIYSKGEAIDKKKDTEIVVIFMWANVNKLKQEIGNNSNNQDTIMLLQEFNFHLIEYNLIKDYCRNEEVYPKLYSLYSLLIRNEGLSLKNIDLTLISLKKIIQNNTYFLQQKNKNIRFAIQCHKRLVQDLKFLIQRYGRLEFSIKNKVKLFAQFLLQFYTPSTQNKSNLISMLAMQKNQLAEIFQMRQTLFKNVILFAQMTELQINLSSYSTYYISIIYSFNQQQFIKSCNNLLKISTDIQMKTKQLQKIKYVVSFINIPYEDGQLTKLAVKFVKHLFHIRKAHCLITIPHHAHNIPLEHINPQHSQENYPIKNIYQQYQKQFKRMLVEVIPFYELEIKLVESVQAVFKNINNQNRENLLHYFSDQLLAYQYQIDMSLTKLYEYLQIIFSIKFLLQSLVTPINLSIIYTIFQTLTRKTEKMRCLKASYVEQQLMISVTLEIVYQCYCSLKEHYTSNPTVANKIKLTQSTILAVQKILDQAAQQSYLIRLITTRSLLSYSKNQPLHKALSNIQATLIHRNKNNISFILNLLALTYLNETDYEQLAVYYMNYENSQVILRNLLPKISVETARKCILTTEKWWLLLSNQVVKWLNCKQMKKEDNKEESFYVADGQNVVIKNALGVIILQISEKWIFYLKSQKRQVIIDIILLMLRVNPEMVFFRSFFVKILQELHLILRQCLGYQHQKLEITCRKHKPNPTKTSNDAIIPNKIEFYDRLKNKIYEIIAEMPSINVEIWQKRQVLQFKSLVQSHHQSVKKEYLFDGKTDLKQEYDLGKLVIQKLQNIKKEQL